MIVSDPPISLCAPCLPLREAGKSGEKERGEGESEGIGKRGGKKTGNTIRGKDQQAKRRSREKREQTLTVDESYGRKQHKSFSGNTSVI